jgi:predicted PurR-regulated permease PerM
VIKIDKKSTLNVIAFLLITIVLSFLLIKPFLTPILTSIFLAYLFYPVYKWINSKINKPNVSAFIVTLLILILVTVPLTLALFKIAKEANTGYIMIKSSINDGTLLPEECADGVLCAAYTSIRETIQDPLFKSYIDDSLRRMTQSVVDGIGNFLFSIPKRVLDLFITFFMIFFLLRDGERAVKAIENANPLRKSHHRKIIGQMHEVTRAIVYGFFLIAAIEGIIATLTFLIFGVQSPFIWGIIVAITALIPFIGASIIWIPASLIKYLGGENFSAMGIVIGGLIISGIDTFLKPKIIGTHASIHPIMMILGMIGGVTLIGPIGIIFGPLILALFVTFLKMYKKSIL